MYAPLWIVVLARAKRSAAAGQRPSAPSELTTVVNRLSTLDMRIAVLYNHVVPLLPVDNVMRARLLGTIGPDSFGIRLFLRGNVELGPYTDGQCQDVANEVQSQWQAAFTNYFPSDTSLGACIVEDLTTGSAGVGVSTGAAVVGTLAGTPLPSGVAICLNFGISSRYRGGHPRVYLPPTTTTYQQDARTWTTAFRHDVEGSWIGMVSAIQASTIGTTIGLGQVAVRYRSHGAVLTPPQVYDIALVTTSSVIASQRRRYNR